MENLDLVKGQKIRIFGESFEILNVIKNSSMIKHDKQIDYYVYNLKPENKNIKKSFIEYFNDSRIILHLNKVVDLEISQNQIKIENELFDIIEENLEIFLDENGELQEITCYKIFNDKYKFPYPELHILENNKNILIASKEIRKEEILNG